MERKVTIEEVCSILEIPVSSYAVKEHMSSEQAKVALEEFKAIVKRQKVVLSKKHHPDKPNGDEEKLKRINATVDLVMKLEITILKQKPKTVVFRSYYNPSGHPFENPDANDNSTSSGTFFRFK